MAADLGSYSDAGSHVRGVAVATRPKLITDEALATLMRQLPLAGGAWCRLR